MSLKIKLFSFLLFAASLSYGQTVIKGVVSDGKVVLENATIIALNTNDNTILNYTISNEKGAYFLTIKSSLDSIKIKASFIGYKTLVKIIVNKNNSVNFQLEEATETLEEVFIKNNPITQRNDTLSYSVNSFKTEKDQVIVDVLRRMPGIEIQLDGKILYQGKPIQKYYIEGLDLLEGKYSLANNNLPVDAVSKIQILENHQPIKILDSVIFSDKASLNIKLKNKKVFIGSAKLGSGFSPLLWDANITPMLFTKNKQLVASYQSNNIGENVANQLKNLTAYSPLERLKSNLNNPDWVRVSPISIPPFSQERWLDNSIHLMSLNYLEKLKNEYQLKTSVSYFKDTQNQKGNINTFIFTPTDTINLIEKKRNTLLFSDFKSKITLEKNTRKSYFKNSAEFNISWNSNKGIIDNQITQTAEIPTKKISNSLKWIFPFKKKLITLNSELFYINNNHKLLINPGQFKDILNNGNPYTNLEQKVHHTKLFTNNSFSFINTYKNFTLVFNNGIQTQKDIVNSLILTDYKKILTTNFLNNLSLNKSIFYINPKIQFENNFAKIQLFFPLNFAKIDWKDHNIINQKKIEEFTFNPKIVLTKDFNAFWQARFSLEKNKSYGEITELYNGFIIKDYRNIKTYNAPISQNNKINQNLYVSYKNPLSGVFISGAYFYTKNSTNLIYDYAYNSNGVLTVLAIEKENTRISHNFSIKASKYFSDLETTFAFGSNLSISKRERLINNQLNNRSNIQKQLKTEIDTDFYNWFNFNAKNNISFTSSENAQGNLEEVKIIKTLVELNIYPNKNNILSLGFENHTNNFKTTNTSNFLNLKYRHLFTDKKMNFELIWLNLLNTKTYQNNFISDFAVTQTLFEIRSSQITASLKFRF